jgi:hypothetical protein
MVQITNPRSQQRPALIPALVIAAIAVVILSTVGFLFDASQPTGYMNSQTVQATCDACHQVLREGGSG